jgi:hypothetical protein
LAGLDELYRETLAVAAERAGPAPRG